MSQKVLKVGTSAAVTIPKKSLKELGLKIGDKVVVKVDKKKKSVIIEPLFNVDQELLEWTDDFISKYRGALEELAKQ